MIIKVTQEDIDQGEPMQADSCPVALALTRHQPQKNSWWYVSDGWLEGGQNYCEAPRSVQRFVRAFDKGKPVKPFNFRLPE